MLLQDRGAVLTGLGMGAGLMYFLDPERGRRRRALMRDRASHSANVGADAVGSVGRDMVHRATGIAARLRRPFRQESVDDAVLAERVKARLGHVVSHPRAIDVEVTDGCVCLRGPVMQAEVPHLLSAIQRVRGVREVVSALEEHEEAGSVPALQGGRTMPAKPQVWHRGWSPTTRLLIGSAGTALTGYGASRRDVPGALLAASGLGLLARAARTSPHG
jgi:osmotically-inducible protein OsmY